MKKGDLYYLNKYPNIKLSSINYIYRFYKILRDSY